MLNKIEKSPLVSICVPIYGVEKYIERCAVTLFEQTYENIEYIFVNDCTKDNSIAMLEEIILRYPARTSAVRIITHEKNRGLAAARNTTVENSTGDFILHVDSDDYIEKDTVELLIKEQQRTNADIVTCGIFMHKSKKIIKIGAPNFASSKEMAIKLIGRQASASIWGRLIRRSLYIDNDIKALEGVNMGEDYSVSPKLAYHAKEVATLQQALFHYDCTNINSYSYKFSKKNADQTWLAYNILEDEFRNKSIELDKALDFGKVEIAINQMIQCCKNKENKDYFLILRNKVRETPKCALKAVPITKRVIMYLSNWNIVRIYVCIAIALK